MVQCQAAHDHVGVGYLDVLGASDNRPEGHVPRQPRGDRIVSLSVRVDQRQRAGQLWIEKSLP